MSAFDNLTISGRAPSSYADPIKLAASKGRSYALEDVADKGVALNVDSKQISSEKAGTQPAYRDRFVKSDLNARDFISDLFGKYSDKLYTVEWYYDDPHLPIPNYLSCTAVEQHGFNEDCIAQIAAEVGKFIDQLYKNGYYTDDEYSQLNDEIEYGVNQWVDQLCGCRASIRIDKERAKIMSMYGYEAYLNAIKKTREERELEFLRVKQQIMEENPPDFDALFALIDQTRNNGESNVNPRVKNSSIWS